MRDARVAPRDLVVEIGAGSGMLTRPLLAAGARVVAVEPDHAFAQRLRRACPSANVVERGWREAPWPSEPFRVVANLPFAEAADICRSLFADPCVPLVSADLIVAWDFAAKRARLWPSTMQTVLWSAWYELTVPRRLPPTVFAPPPSVAAGILRARRRENPLVDPRRAGGYSAFVLRQFKMDPRAREVDPHGWAVRFRPGEERPFGSVR